MARLIAVHPKCSVKQNKNYFKGLVLSIISQQLSSKAADSIYRKVVTGLGKISPETFAAASREQLRAYGLSYAKVTALQDLSNHILKGSVSFRGINKLSDDEVTAMLTRVKGIGEWTAHMFLMFILARPNILPTGDLSIRKAVQKFLNLPELPAPDSITEIARKRRWHPYCTVACWYLWRVVDNPENDAWA